MSPLYYIESILFASVSEYPGKFPVILVCCGESEFLL